MAQRSNKRDAIIQAAMDMLADEGLQGFTASLIATRAGVSKANLFHHFPQLDDLMLACFSLYSDGVLGDTAEQTTSLVDWMVSMGKRALGSDAENRSARRVYISFVARAMTDERLRISLEALAEGGVRLIADRLLSDPDMTTTMGEAQTLARLCLVTLDGMVVHAGAFPDQEAALLEAWIYFVAAQFPAA